MTEPTFEGLPLDELPIRAIDWLHRAEHIRTRSKRNPGDFDVEPASACTANDVNVKSYYEETEG